MDNPTAYPELRAMLVKAVTSIWGTTGPAVEEGLIWANTCPDEALIEWARNDYDKTPDELCEALIEGMIEKGLV